ncbi:SNF2 family N-terminal domain-containing protein [Phakopsora pachyrhizi]|uniref:SNF2 family N-terminal domain-domain-containing protein n=1 Tax=Phakopsora pachyrhizi TaxID=170000 RepID=A0AAV0AGM3_PHAPC|nr:SNF2 family N-terminal domain-containing protein [Phakopsora pachyrhizi]CAH7667145.1 SNF2 family N-terminal domain-domain-containing protein [Phakopsora pachyrhizi]
MMDISSSSPQISLDSVLTTPVTSVDDCDGVPRGEKPAEVIEEAVVASFEDVPLDDCKLLESREKLSRLNFLLKASGIYSKIIADNIGRERASREAAINKHTEELVKKGVPKDPTIIAEKRQTRKNPRTSVTSSKTRRKRQKIFQEKPSDEADQVDELVKNVNAKNEELKPVSPEQNLGQPAILTGATMRPYQLAGMHWLATLYENGLNGILADEMGLGKTLQTIAFLCYLRERGVWGPFLIVCPLSTVANWVNEFERFCPGFPVVLYHGTKSEREEIRASRLAPPTDDPRAWISNSTKSSRKFSSKAKDNFSAKNFTSKNTKATFPVLVTSYEIVMNDKKFLSLYAWSYIVVDESHRLKNLECKLVQELKSYKSANRLLLTGTPLHNNLKELWSLLNFILPEIFDDYSAFEQWFDLSSVTAASDSAAALSTAQAQHIVSNLHEILRPFLLRRTKNEVESSLPKKKEYLLSAPLTIQQKELYDAVINRSLRALLYQQKSQATLEASKQESLPIFTKAEEMLPLSTDRTNIVTGSLNPDSGLADYPEDSSEDNAPLISSSQPAKRRKTSRALARNRISIGYAERSDSQFFQQVDQGYCDEVNYDFDEDYQSSKKITQEKSHEQQAEEVARKSVNQMKLQNVVMQLRKVCNHPWLFNWPIDPKTGEHSVGEGLISASGKMLLLDKLLKGLFERGHKVLIFSQFTSMLDIIHDWATEFKGWDVCRIDGSTSQDERRRQMKSFNQSEGVDECNLFLLSTRAGGVGINLVAADTVILFDSDWNPQQDLQAQDRVHRIGQTKPVLVFRLVSGNTVESKMLQKASEKRKLETLVIGNGFDLTKKQEDNDSSDDDIQNIILGKKSNRRKQKSMKELAEALLKADGEKIILAAHGDEIIRDSQLEALLDRSENAMERKPGWKAEASATGATGVEVYRTEDTT